MDKSSSRRPTIRDIARVAGVSRGTVSRVLNGGHLVSPQAREAVETAIAKTGYTANHHARSLATGRAGSLAFLLTEPQHLLFADPTFSRLLRGAAAALGERDMTLILLVAATDEERARVANYVSAGHVDGVLLISSHEDDPLPASLIGVGIPTVSCGLPLGLNANVPTVAVDEVGSAKEMTRYLRSKGHRRVAMIAGPQDLPGGRFRLQGFEDQMGSDFDPRLIEIGDYSRESGSSAMERLLDRGLPIDAVFAASDSMAAGAIAALQRAGVTVPDDIAVAGFDDSDIASECNPPLTTMRQPWDQISEAMVSMLLDIIAGRQHDPVTLPTQLIVRQSA